MPRRKTPYKAPPIVLIDDKPRVFEGFASSTPLAVSHLQEAPIFWNALVLRRFRITVEVVDEPLFVLAERLRLLWRRDNNAHHADDFRKAATELGIVLDDAERGVDLKDNT